MMRPRKDWCLVRIVQLDKTESGLAMPDIAIEGKEVVGFVEWTR
jgi:hypothetical protein